MSFSPEGAGKPAEKSGVPGTARKPMGEEVSTPIAPAGQPMSGSIPHRTSSAHSTLLPPSIDHMGE